MTEAQRIDRLETNLAQALQALSALEARLSNEASQRAAADMGLAQRISIVEAKCSP